MLIGFDASRAFINNRTGTENYSYQILYHLSKIDHSNNYYIYLRPGVDIKNITSLGNFPPNFQFFILNFQFLWTQIGLAWQTFRDPLDVLFVPAHTLPIVHRPGLKTVMTVHDLGAEFLPQTHQLKQKLYLKFITDYQLKSATALIAVSQSTKKDLIKKAYLKADNIFVVYEGISHELFKPVKNESRGLTSCRNNELLRDILKHYDLVPGGYFLFVGTIQPRKNLKRLISAYAQFLKVNKESSLIHKSSIINPKSLPSLVLAGSKGWLSDEIYQLPQILGIQNQVRFLGFVPDNYLPALYTGAKALLFPSLFEGFGLPILEAFSCGCPVLTSNVSSIPEIAGKAAVYVDPYSTDDIAKGIKKVFTDPPSKHLGFEQVKKFSWEKAAFQTLQLLEKVSHYR